MKNKVNKKNKGMDKRSSLIIGGKTMIGIGLGFFLLPISALFFVGSIMAGIGLGLVIAPIISRSSG